MKLRGLIFAVLLSIAFLLTACASSASVYELKDGYYAAEAAEFDEFGWKEYVSVYVSAGEILTVEYDAFDPCGFVKSWDIEYMRRMNAVSGTYPNEYARVYTVSLLNWQDPDGVDVMTGATGSHEKFVALAKAAIAQAAAGDKQVALVYFSDAASGDHAQ